jgi:hypothetical protein
MDDEHDTMRTSSSFGWGLLVGMTLFVAALLRFTGLNWDLAQWIHPDEGHMRMVTSAIRLPEEPGLYFDTARSPLNPRNNGQTYSYGTLPLFATRALAEWVERGCERPDGEAVPPLNAGVARLLLQQAGAPVRIGEGGAPACPEGTFTGTYNAFLGRHLAALADLGTVLLLFLVGRRLYGTRAGLLAMALGAVTVLLIQQAHFYTVDSAATFFTMLAALFAVRAADQGVAGRPIPWVDLALGGVAVGLAAACKVSAAVAAGLVALGGLAWVLRRSEALEGRHGPRLLRALSAIVLPLVLAGLLAAVAFRGAQPYAFQGPGFFGVRPDPDWFARLRQIGEEQSGTLDFPSGRQWTNRWPVLFPWLNMVVWGMGLPLGLAVCAGWAVAGLELVRGRGVGGSRPYRHLVPWVWSTLFFVFYATRWVKAMRYFTPLYPLLIVMGAYVLVRLLRTDPEPATSAVAQKNLRSFCGPKVWGFAAVVLVVAFTAAWGAGFFTIYLRSHTRIAGSRWIYANVPEGSVLANEHWDWGLPLRIDGRDGFRDAYRGLTLELYHEDTPEKRAQLLDQLDEADYLIMASNRLYSSIPRLPERYPLTTTYYRALFAGELGFELAAEFTSYIRIGPLTFPDQENPFPLMAPADLSTQGHLPAVPLPPAEESFSVYDHPNCFIFRKTPAYSRAGVEAVFAAVDLDAAQAGLSPHEATPAAVRVAHTVAFAVGVTATAVVVGLVVVRPPKPEGRPTSEGLYPGWHGNRSEAGARGDAGQR